MRVLTCDDTDFIAAKNMGFDGVVIDFSDDTEERIKRAKDAGLEVFISVSETEAVECKYLENIGGRFSEKSGFAQVVTVEHLDKLLSGVSKELNKIIDGFILPTPEFSGLIYACESEYELSCEQFLELFVDETIISSVRSWYYENIEKIIMNDYLLPLVKWADKNGKNISFNIGKPEIQCDLAGNMINPFRLQENGISVAAYAGNAETDSFLCSLKDSIAILEDLNIKKNETADILLIKPSRGIMERYVYRKRSGAMRKETPAVLAATEARFYEDMLYEKDLAFNVTDEFAIEKFASSKKGKLYLNGNQYSQVLICDSCSFSDEGIKILKSALRKGVCINNEALTDVLMGELLEEV